MRRTGEYFHVNAYLRQQVSRRSHAYAGNLAQTADFFFKGPHAPADFGIQLFYLVSQMFHAAPDGTEHELVVLTELPLYGQGDFLLSALQTPMSTKRGRELGVRIARNHIVYDSRAGLARHIAEYAGQFQVDILEYAYQAVVLGGQVLNQFAACKR